MIDTAKITAIALPLIQQFEGFEAEPYLDTAQVPTIGYGTTYYLDGSRVTMQDPPIDKTHALQLLGYKIAHEFLPGVLGIFDSSEKVTVNQYASLVSFAYNEGVHGLASSTLAAKLKLGDVAGAANEFPKWDMANHQESQGLLNRREKEKALFLTPAS